MNNTNCIIFSNIYLFLKNDIASINIFFDKKIFSTRYLYNQKLMKDNFKSEIIKYIEANNIKYIVVGNDLKPMLTCLNLEKIAEISKKTAVRNFLVEKKIFKSYLYKIGNSSC